LLDTNIAAFDIDDCRNPESKEIDPFAMALVKRANSYTEITVSGTGLRIIGTGSTRNLHTKKKVPRSGISVEAYRNCERYITISNMPLDGVTTELNDIDTLLDEVIAELDAAKAKPTPPPQKGETTANAFTFLERGLPPDLLTLIRDGVPVGQRSDQFFHAVKWLKEKEWSIADIVTLLFKHPDGISAKWSKSRRKLEAEVRRVYDKPDSKPPDADSTQPCADKQHAARRGGGWRGASRRYHQHRSGQT
jgi:putative DNA primase/helicase